PKKFRVQFLVMQKSSKSLKIRIMKSIFSNFHPQIMVKKLKYMMRLEFCHSYYKTIPAEFSLTMTVRE
ncbi:MAG: hypothetical protein WCT05_05845, partial [Lentisphaeria bacterium]